MEKKRKKKFPKNTLLQKLQSYFNGNRIPERERNVPNIESIDLKKKKNFMIKKNPNSCKNLNYDTGKINSLIISSF